MSNFVLLNNIAHKNLKVIRNHAPKYGDDSMFAITFPEEFRTVQGVYPIFFHKDLDNGQFFPAAIFGFRENENLFLSDKGWDAPYIPLSIKRRPFLIGMQSQPDQSSVSKMMVYVDMDSPRLSETDGEPVFLSHGGYSPYLESVVGMLDYIHVGANTSDSLVDALLKYDLLESFTLDIELRNGAQNKLVGFYTINEDKLKTLGAEVLAELHQQGYLEYIYMVLASMSNISNLIERIEKRINAAKA